MDDLKPSQIVLLSVFVSFVASISTTIISLAFLSDTPISITEVVHRVSASDTNYLENRLTEIKDELKAEASVMEELPVVAGSFTKNSQLDIEVANSYLESNYNNGLWSINESFALAFDDKFAGRGDLFSETGTYEFDWNGVLFLHSEDFVEISFVDGVLLLDNVLLFDYVQNQFFLDNWSSTILTEKVLNYEVTYSRLVACKMSPSALVIYQGEIAGFCTGQEDFAFLGLKRFLER